MPFDLFHCGAPYTLTRQDGLTVPLAQALRTRDYVILFLASQWWAPCRGVTAQLCAFYAQHHATHNFEVIFLSTDKSEGAMRDFFADAHGDWLCLDYKDARTLEAALAGDPVLHAQQVPACLVFQLDKAALLHKPQGERGSTHRLLSSSSSSSSLAPAACVSFARLITKHGREMLSRDRGGLRFPWHDNGWTDTASVQRTPTLNTPTDATITSPVSQPSSPDPAVVGETAETNAVESTPSVVVHRHVDAVLHTDPRASPAVAIPHTQRILMCSPSATSAAAAAADGPTPATEAKDTMQEAEKDTVKGREDAQHASRRNSDGDAPVHETSPDSRRQLFYPNGSVAQNQETVAEAEEEEDPKRVRPPTRVMVVRRRVRAPLTMAVADAATVVTDVETETEVGEDDTAAAAEVREEGEADVVLVAHISAVMEENWASGEGNEGTAGSDVEELSVVERDTDEVPQAE